MYALQFHCRKYLISVIRKNYSNHDLHFIVRMGIQPTVGECDGTYNYDSRKHFLQWNLPIIDASNKAGSLEFSAASSIPGDFFPLQVYIEL